jgi:hypothetical protein
MYFPEGKLGYEILKLLFFKGNQVLLSPSRLYSNCRFALLPQYGLEIAKLTSLKFEGSKILFLLYIILLSDDISSIKMSLLGNRSFI